MTSQEIYFTRVSNGLKEYLCSKFEKALAERGYLDESQINSILSEGVRNCLGLELKDLRKTGADKTLWWIFVTPNYEIHYLPNKRDFSGIHKFNRENVGKAFGKYERDLKERLKNIS